MLWESLWSRVARAGVRWSSPGSSGGSGTGMLWLEPGTPTRLHPAVKSGLRIKAAPISAANTGGQEQWGGPGGCHGNLDIRSTAWVPKDPISSLPSFRCPNAVLGEEVERLSNYLKRLCPRVSWSWRDRILKLKGDYSNTKRLLNY